MTKKEKIIGNLAGYAGIVLLFGTFVLSVLSISANISFRGDAFVMLAICALFEICREKYLKFRTIENEEWKKTKQKNKRIITVVATYDISDLQGCKLTPAEDVKKITQRDVEEIFAEDEGYEGIDVTVEDI